MFQSSFSLPFLAKKKVISEAFGMVLFVSHWFDLIP